MRLGIFARTFQRNSLEEILDAIVEHSIRAVHFNYACAGLASLPEEIEEGALQAIRKSFQDRNLDRVAVSGTFNAIHPDREFRKKQTDLCCGVIRSAKPLGTGVVTLCTGTRDADNMWRRHPDNESEAAWKDLLATLEILVSVAEEEGTILGIEPETANVIDSAPKARRLLDAMKTPTLKIVLDGANLFFPETLDRMEEILKEATDLLGPDLIMAHAKDIVHDPNRKSQAAGTGLLDYEIYLRCLSEAGFDGPLILHNLEESEVETSLAFVREKASRFWNGEKTL
jgi:sugar phosphate isomerase/epimerase